MERPDCNKLPSATTHKTTLLCGFMMIEAAAKLKAEGKIQ
jgi:hypothetical protein